MGSKSLINKSKKLRWKLVIAFFSLLFLVFAVLFLKGYLYSGGGTGGFENGEAGDLPDYSARFLDEKDIVSPPGCAEIMFMDIRVLQSKSNLGSYDVMFHRGSGGAEIQRMELTFFNSLGESSESFVMGEKISQNSIVSETFDISLEEADVLRYNLFILDDNGGEIACPRTRSIFF